MTGPCPPSAVATSRVAPAVRALLLSLATLLHLTALHAGDVRIHELFFHPPTELDREEWIELANTGTKTVDLSAWRFTEGVRFTFPPGTRIEPGGFLVVAANLASFKALHPNVTNVVAGWEGILSNSGQQVRLVDAAGQPVDSVRYADDGEWAERVRDAVDYGHRGWKWDSAADGGGRSLELRRPALPSSHGRNWAPSVIDGGTPGRPNSTATTNLPPLLADVRHRPLVPRSTEPVVVNASVLDEAPAAQLQLTLHWRVDGTPAFSTVAMHDDGLHQDGAPGDGIVGAVIPPQTNNAIVEFYITATDPSGQSRTWPAPALDDGVPRQALNALYQVDDTAQAAPPKPGELPRYRLILLAADRAELESINRNSPAAPFPQPAPFNDQTRSHAQFNATFIASDGTGTALRYLVGVRNRGNGSRFKRPQGLRLHLRNDDLWNKTSDLNLNSQYAPAQLLGSALYQRAGLAAAASRAIHLRVNNRDLQSPGSPSFGFYVANEVINSEFAARAFPSDASGNLYRGIRLTGDGANLAFLGTNAAPYRANYFKQSNTSQDQWQDLVELCRVLDTEPDATYADAVERVVHVDAWLRYFALETLVDNRETNLGNGNNGTGQGDDYNLYFGRNDPRALVVPYDLDTILGLGDTAFHPNDGLFRMAANPRIARFIKHPRFAPAYHAMLLALARNDFAPDRFNPLVDEVLGGLADEPVRQAFKDFAAARLAGVLAQIPVTLSATNSAVPFSNGAYQTPAASIPLQGRAHAATTRAVLVNGQPASWSAWNATWTLDPTPLRPGINRILVQSLDAAGRETARLHVHVVSTAAPGTPAAGTLTSDQRWTRVGSPWRVTASVTVATGATLVIEPGTTVYLGTGANLTVNNGGRLLAEGTAAEPIVFARDPAAASNWGGITLNGGPGSPLNRITHAWIDGNNATAIHAVAATLEVDHVAFGNTARQYLSLDASSFVVSHCHFPHPTAEFEPLHGSGGIKAGGVGILRHCFVGAPRGYNDAFDFTGGNRPGQPILQILNNVFAGSGDDLLDLDGTDAWVEGNLFLHVHRNGSPDSASAVSGGSSSGQTSEITVIGNLFYDCDHAVTAKQGNFYTVLHNTLVRITREGGVDSASAVFNLADDGTTAGAGLLLADNVITDAPVLARNHNPAASTVTLHRNLLPVPWEGTGSSNRVARPVFFRMPALAETFFNDFDSAQVLRSWFRQAPSSPGADLTGFDAPPGTRVAGLPRGLHRSRELTLHVGPIVTNGLPAAWAGGSGYTRYRWSLDDGPWSDWTASTTPLALAGLADGPHQLAVVGLNDAGLAQDDPRFGDDATVTRTATWQVEAGGGRVLLGEVLARNQSFPTSPGVFPDLVEVFNDGASARDLSGLGIASRSNRPAAFRFPAGTVLQPGARLVLTADGDLAASATHIPFGLDASGDEVWLLDRTGAPLDGLRFGPQLADRSIGRLPDGSWTLCEPTFGGLNRTAAVAPPDAIRINEWLAASAAQFSADFIELHNPGDLPVPLAGLFLTDNPLGQPRRHALPALGFIDARGYLALIADGDTAAGPDHLGFKLDAAGGVLQLATADAVLDTLFYGPQFDDVSQGRTPNGSTQIRFLSTPTPGTGNPGGAGGESNIVTTNSPGMRSVVLNEVVARNDAFPEPNGALVDWVELHNPNATALDLGGLALTDDPAQPDRFTFAPGTIIAGLGFLRVQLVAPASGETAAPQSPAAAFGLNADGDRLYLLDTPARARALLDAVTFGRLPRNLALARVPDGNGPWTLGRPTPGATNAPVPLADAAAVTVNEWMANPATGEDWFELHNPGVQPVDLSGWHLTDNLTLPTKHRIPAHTYLGSGPDAFLQIQADGSAGISASHAGFKLDAKGESLGLARPDGTFVQSLSFGASAPGVSQGRFPDDSATLASFPTLPTPGAPNRADADRDRLPDDWELAHGLSPATASDAWEDLDGDGSANAVEFQAGTDPRDPASVFALRIEPSEPGLLGIAFTAVTGRSYSIEVSPGLETAAWTVGLRVPARPSPREFHATVPLDAAARFVRVVID